MDKVRAKFRVDSVTRYARTTSVQVALSAVTADEVEENQRFHKYTPSGAVSMTIDNPAAAAMFEPGAELYVDFTPVPAPAA